MKTHRSSFEPAYIRWQMEFAAFEGSCFETLCEFIRAHFEDLLDRYYWEGHESLKDFSAWAFERFIRDLEPMSAREGLQ